MEAAAFELNLSLPQEERFVPMARDLAVHAAERAGCGRPDAESFGRVVADLLVRCVREDRCGSQVDR